MKNWLKDRIRSWGFDVIKHPPAAPLHVHLKRFISQTRIDLVLDVGAFDGSFCAALRQRVGYEGRIVSFEPCGVSFTELSKKFASDPQWTGLNFGLSSSDNEAILHTFDKGDFNSIHKLREREASIFEVGRSRPEIIQLRQLDNIWHDIVGSPARALLKIDTQGHDIEVVMGAKNHLRSVVGILSELPAVEIYEGMTSMPDAIKLLSELGYRPAGFYPVNHGYGGEAAEFDVIFMQTTESKH